MHAPPTEVKHCSIPRQPVSYQALFRDSTESYSWQNEGSGAVRSAESNILKTKFQKLIYWCRMIFDFQGKCYSERIGFVQVEKILLKKTK